MGRPKEHGTSTREALLAAATEILGKDGVSAVTVRRVAEHAGTTTRAVYALFGDKDGLLRALFRLEAETMRRHHEAVPVDEDPIRELHALADAYRAAAHEQPQLYGLFIGSTAVRPTEEDIAVSFRAFQRVQEAIGRAVKRGLLRDGDQETLGRQLWAVVHGLASLELAGCLGDSDEAAAHWHGLTSACLAGYRQLATP
jgi:AcrR family transcriptional regulator